MRRLDRYQFIWRAIQKHGYKYDYNDVIYHDNKSKVLIGCPLHGIFEQKPNNHLIGDGCPKCANMQNGNRCRSNKEDFIAKAILIHGNVYDYEHVYYVNNVTKIIIGCQLHGLFEQTPNDHLNGRGCLICGNKRKGEKHRLTKKAFIDKAILVHGDKYEYSNIIYNGNKAKINIGCKEHGLFEQTPNDHLRGKGCPICGGSNTLTTSVFIEKAKIVHGQRYVYSGVTYVNNHTKISIGCPEHGIFKQNPNKHLNGRGCPICGGSLKLTTQEFINKAKLVHGNKYDYSQIEYVNAFTKIQITCIEHGTFLQTPTNHLNGQGCPVCNESKLEKNMRKYLNENNILFEYQKRFPWLKHQSLDFYLPELNIGIECQGEQHFKPIDFAGRGLEWAKKELVKTKKRDAKKKELCLKYGIKILYYNYDDFKNPLECEKIN